MSFLRKIDFPFWTVPLLFLGVGIAAYGLLAHLQGYYWDDWGFAWLTHFYGADGLMADFGSTGRPWLGAFHVITHSLIGEDPFVWQVFGILCRCLAALAFLWMLRNIWPEKTRQATWAALLFLVYPGFSQQFIAITYSHFFLIQVAFFASMGLTVLAIRRPERAWFYQGVAMLLAAFNLFMIEYLVVLELLRPLLVWWVIRKQAPSRRIAWMKLIRNWVPFILLMGIYLYWRIFVLSQHLYQPVFFASLKASPLDALLDLGGTILYDMIKTSLFAWGKIFQFPGIADFGLRSTLVYAALVLLGAASVWFYLLHFHPDTKHENGVGTKGEARQWLVTGLAALFLAGWPFWIAQLSVHLVHPNDRFTLAFIPGVSILFVGLIDLLPEKRWLKAAILAVMVGLAVGLQFQNGNLFRRDWKTQQAFFWQLAWRAPALEPGTTIMSAYILPMSFNSDGSLTAPLNWMYAPDNHSEELSYLMVYASERSWLVFEKDQPIQRPYPPTLFTGSTSAMVVIHFDPPGCLRMLDPIYDSGIPLLPPDTQAAMFLSDTSRILPNPKQAAVPSADLFGSEPGHGWCYYFEKAELARQQEDWSEVAHLGDLGLNLDDSPNDASEYVVFIEGYANVGRWDDATRLTRRSLEITPLMNPMLCKAWQRIATESEEQAIAMDMLAELACEIP